MTTSLKPPLIHVEPVPRDLIVGNRQAFKARLAMLLEEGLDVIVNFTDSQYLDSSGLGALYSMHREYAARGRALVICGLNDDLVTLFELTKLDTVFVLYPDVDTARAAIERL